MTEPCPHDGALFNEVHRLVTLCLEGGAVSTDLEALEDLVDSDPQARHLYVQYLGDSIGLRSITSKPAEIPLHDTEPPAVVEDDAQAALQIHSPRSPILGFLGNPVHGTLNYFSDGWPLAYLIATVIFGIGLSVASLVMVTHHVQVAQKSSPSVAQSYVSEKTEYVGKITGMVNVKWSDATTAAVTNLVELGRKYALASGLMEITYDTGAKVILQGPCTYEAESKVGGFLSIGKLTAKLEKKNDESRMMNDELQTTQNSIQHLFAVRTPTATVTDLGTEFGVDVDKQGNTTSQVFRGAVRLQMISVSGKAEGSARVLQENQSARVELRSENQDSDNLVRVFVTPAKPADFVREIPRANPKPIIKAFDLVDVVAGGNGFSGRRGGGIDPTTGRATDTPPEPRETWFNGDQKYHRVESLPLVDGVFIPNGPSGKVQVDSAGHTFADFPKTDNKTACYIWAGGAIPMDHVFPSLTVLDGIDYALPGHGVLFLHANKGITFDLEAVRKANPDWKPIRFCAVTGNTEKDSEKGLSALADVWVLVDGQVRYRRREINGYNGAFSVAIPIGRSERFLTLAATDSGNSIGSDWIIFGDPRLELESVGAGVKQDVTTH